MAQHRPTQGASRLILGLTAGLGIAALSYVGYAALTYYRYGQTVDGTAADDTDTLVDQFIPVYEVRERHEIRVRASAGVTFAAARDLDLRRSPLVQAIFALRTLPSRWRGEPATVRPRRFLAEVLSIGWGVLAEVPDHEIVLGAVTEPWEPVVQFRPLPPAEFAAFHEPGYAKIIWTLAAEPLGTSASLFRTETRVRTTDPASRERFRRYWAVFSPGVMLIRYEALRLVKNEAERRR